MLEFEGICLFCSKISQKRNLRPSISSRISSYITFKFQRLKIRWSLCMVVTLNQKQVCNQIITGGVGEDRSINKQAVFWPWLPQPRETRLCLLATQKSSSFLSYQSLPITRCLGSSGSNTLLVDQCNLALHAASCSHHLAWHAWCYHIPYHKACSIQSY
jgi:hypothetical protein